MDKTIIDLNERRDTPEDQALGPLEFDPDKYRHNLEEFDLTQEEQDELLRILFTIMAAFVDLGFGVDSIHYLKNEETLPDQKIPRLTGPKGDEGDST